MTTIPEEWEEVKERVNKMTEKELKNYIKEILEDRYYYWEQYMESDL